MINFIKKISQPRYFGYGVYGYKLLGFRYYWWLVQKKDTAEKHYALDFFNLRIWHI